MHICVSLHILPLQRVTCLNKIVGCKSGIESCNEQCSRGIGFQSVGRLIVRSDSTTYSFVMRFGICAIYTAGFQRIIVLCVRTPISHNVVLEQLIKLIFRQEKKN